MATQFTGGATTGASVTPSASPQTLQSNYIDFTSTSTAGWAQQYLPDLVAQEAEVFGNRTIGGFLEQVGAEEAMSADQVVWSEQGRLHLSYKGNTDVTAATPDTVVFTVVKDSDGKSLDGLNCGVRKGDLVLISDPNSTVKAYVTNVAQGVTVGGSSAFDKVTCSVISGTISDLTDTGTADATEASTLFVFGSEYAKGTTGRDSVIAPSFKSYSNKPVIIKDKYEVSGSDASQIGWVEVSGEEGQSGYYWYLKAAGDTKSRFADYCEMTLLEHEMYASNGTTNDAYNSASNTIAAHQGGAVRGTEGFFQAVNSRGLTFDGLVPSGGASNHLNDFDAILKEFDKQGAIEEYMMFLNRDTSLIVDEMLANQNILSSGGSSYGVFDNDADMALNLGFSGFRRGSYDFYKTDWKYLNDSATRGGIADTTNQIRGAFVPAGVSSVYDQNLGKNLKRPFLHVRYRASQMEDRKFKTWTTGSVGAATSDLDAMEMNFLTERCLVTQGANNFMLLKGTGTY